jgi:hypothetical protein
MLPSFSSRATRFHTSGASTRFAFACSTSVGIFSSRLMMCRKRTIFRRVMQNVRCVKRVADELDVYGRVVTKVLNSVELEQRHADVVSQNLRIGLLLAVESGCTDRRQPFLDVLVEAALRVDSGWTQVVDRFVERHALVLVVAGLRRRDRREREHVLREIVGQRRKIRSC